MPADTVETSAARVASIASLITSPMVACIGPTAAWVHGAGDRPPHLHHVQRAVSRRIRVSAHPRVRFHDSALDPADTVDIAGIAVTTPLRTLSDLARGTDRHPSYRTWALALLRVDPSLGPQAQEALQSRRQMPGKLTGLRLLQELMKM